MEEFYRSFGQELSDVERGNEAYRRYCERVGICTLLLLIFDYWKSGTDHFR